MIRTFRNNFDYIEYITSFDPQKGEVFCYNYIPSAFFPKDILDFYFDKKEYIEKHSMASELLWQFGKKFIRNLQCGNLEIAIEFDSFARFIETGVIHEATENFEISFSSRIKVIDNIIKYLDCIYFLPEPTPFIFRLIPLDTVIIDVKKNKASQTIQGIAIQDRAVYLDFMDEFIRLKETSKSKVSKGKLLESLECAKRNIKSGYTFKF
jgi:hypothetical protein